MNKNKFHDTHGKIQHSEKVFRANLIIVNYLLGNEHFCEICRIYRIHHLKILLEVWLERTTLKEGSSNSLKFSSDESPWKFWLNCTFSWTTFQQTQTTFNHNFSQDKKNLFLLVKIFHRNYLRLRYTVLYKHFKDFSKEGV